MIEKMTFGELIGGGSILTEACSGHCLSEAEACQPNNYEEESSKRADAVTAQKAIYNP